MVESSTRANLELGMPVFFELVASAASASLVREAAKTADLERGSDGFAAPPNLCLLA